MSWHWRMIQNLKRNWLVVSNWHEKFYKFWPKHSNVSKICTLMGSFWPKYIMFELKKYRGVMFDGTEDWCKIWRKTDLCFLKWHEEFGKFSFIGWKIAISFMKTKWWNIIKTKIQNNQIDQIQCENVILSWK